MWGEGKGSISSFLHPGNFDREMKAIREQHNIVLVLVLFVNPAPSISLDAHARKTFYKTVKKMIMAREIHTRIQTYDIQTEV